MLHPYQDKWPQLGEEVFLAEGSQVIGDVEIGDGSSIWFNTVLRGDVFPIRIGKKTNIQDNSVIHVTVGMHSAVIEDEVTVGHRVILHGCRVKRRALIGMGSVLLDGAEIGEESLIGAGSLVTPGTVIPPRSLALGSPCRVIRPLREEEIQKLLVSAEHYCELARSYLRKS
ncbi:MAG TPA: gamma carbonic anhydrase family protein [Deltaproteobacteria bacterium]|nr:gamma carbonic anhydrase family protein [Deltaproteobacteria bacterium]